MGNGNNENPTSADLYAEIAKRKAWFFECQLRRLNLESFRDVEVNDPKTESLLKLISKPATSAPLGSKVGEITYVYLDSEQPVWTREERDQRSKFKDFIGLEVNWLNYRIPLKLKERLEELKTQYEGSKFSSLMDDEGLKKIGRRDSSISRTDPNKPPEDTNILAHAISRVEITQEKPWLIAEIFNGLNTDPSEPEQWLENGELFVSNYERELNEVLGGNRIGEPFTLGDVDKYRDWIKDLLKDSVTARTNTPAATKVEFLDTSQKTWKFNIKISTPNYPLNSLQDYSVSDGVKYWIDTCTNALEEIYINKADSDMGLCLIMRALYLYGTLPSDIGGGKELPWRNRHPPTPDFHHFFAAKAKKIGEKPDLQDRLLLLQTKLQILLEQTADNPHSGAIHFSPLAQEVIKQDILGYKFWLDESFSAYHNAGNPGNDKMLSNFNRARRDIGEARKASGRGDIELFSEKEYWSENHYIMFASSEYLAGQLWEKETFQPGRDFLQPVVFLAATETAVVPVAYADTSVELSGESRMKRGRARVLKWLNNRLMFGWTEFNSSGYYREHLMALLNLVDFSLDEEVKTKATMVTDLLFFDLVRFSHKGSMGAAGGRSQFKSKCAGWDNALGDVIEILLGTRGIFLDRGSEIGCSFASSTYNLPDALLQIGSKPPPPLSVDRSRVSVTFEEAAKYGIQYSQKSDQKESIQNGFSSKRTTHYAFLKNVNDEIARTHQNYAAKEDDTVFWWTQSAYFNKEVVKNTFELIKTFGLSKCDVFNKLVDVIKHIIPFTEKTSHGLVGAAIGSVTGAGVATLAGAALGFFLDDILDYSIIEEGSNDLAFFLEGSTRTRANILTYRNRDVMLSSLQNFRPGQFNFQTNVNQATLNTSVNIFTTAAFAGLDLSSFETGFLGGVLGGAVSGGFAGAILGAAVGILGNEIAVEGESLLATHGDGPGWWTGHWALPMVVQHESAAILAYDFNTIQKKLAKVGSHVWFPTIGFKNTEERRTSAYDDDNLFLLDIGDIGPEGFWLFGQMVHKDDPSNPDANEEAYIGVFSNQRPEWLTKDSDFYSARLKEQGLKVQNEFSSLFLFADFFAEKDWYAKGKNIWIIQVGNKDEFGSFDSFKDRVSKAKVLLDDAGDMECSYAIPKSDGSSQTLSLKYGDGGKFSLDGKPFDTDLYPRFENKFVRGGLVEWGQREYVIEYNGKSLLHDFSNMEQPVRAENATTAAGDADTVKGLVIYLSTGDEEMKVFTVATATATIGCEALALDEVIAAGEVDENTVHDAEWIFLDKPGQLSPDMTIEIKHPPGSDGEDEPEWKMSFSLRALMGDRILYDCSIDFPGWHFEDGLRSTGPIPFTVQISKWRTWQTVEEPGRFGSWQIASQPPRESFYYKYFDLLAIDNFRRLWHRRSESCPGSGSEWKTVGNTGQSLLFDEPASLCSVSTQPDNLFLFAMNSGELFNCFAFAGEDLSTKQWTTMKVETIPTTIFGLPDPKAAPVPVPLSSHTRIVAKILPDWQVAVGLYLSAADNSFYSRSAWVPGDTGSWRQIATDAMFVPLTAGAFEVCGDHLFVLDDHRRLWVGAIDYTEQKITPSWKQLSDDKTTINNFSVAYKGEVFVILINANQGEVQAAVFSSADNPVIWERVGAANNFLAIPKAKLAWAVTGEGHLDIFTTGTDKRIYTIYWSTQQGWDLNRGWNVIDDEGHQFEASESAPLAVLNRVSNQLEVFTSSRDQQVWKTWWT